MPSARAAVAADYARAGVPVDPEQRGAHGQLQRVVRVPVQALLRSRGRRAGPRAELPAVRIPGASRRGGPRRLSAGVRRRLARRLRSIDRGWRSRAARGATARAPHRRQPQQPDRIVPQARRAGSPVGTICGRPRIWPSSPTRCSPRYPFGRQIPTRVRAGRRRKPAITRAPPAFSLGGLSKACGLPQLKLGLDRRRRSGRRASRSPRWS